MALFTFIFGAGRGVPDAGPVCGRRVLGAGRVLRLARGEAEGVYCAKGRLWITQEGNPDDIVIGAGERCPVGGGAVVEVLLDAEINILAGVPRRAFNVSRSRRPASPAPRSRRAPGVR